MSQTILPVSPSVELMNGVFDALQQQSSKQRMSSARDRIRRLDALYKEIWCRRDDLKSAMWEDFRKPGQEVDLTEIFVVKSEIKFVKKRLRKWMKPRRVSGGLALLGSASWVRSEAKGVALIIAPWNYPMQLVFRPLIAAIAAGCTVLLKPSELTGKTAGVIAEIVAAVFPENEVSVVQGGVETATHLLSLPFNHMYFTGSPEVGKIVMRAAAQHPCSVTLELGGKSPVILDDSAPLKATAKKIAWAKLANAGQICVAPDYIFVPRSMESDFVEALKSAMMELYPGVLAENPDYQRIIKGEHAQRLLDLTEDAVSKGAKVSYGGASDAEDCFVHPTILSDLSPEAQIMQEEVFGPVLPVIAYDDIQEVIHSVNSRPVPLALYIYSKRNRVVNQLLDAIQSGGASINNSVIHVSSNHLPFGGLGNSGIGSGHGQHGFNEFTHMRGVYEQRVRGAVALLMPPYRPWKTKVIDRLLRWL